MPFRSGNSVARVMFIEYRSRSAAARTVGFGNQLDHACPASRVSPEEFDDGVGPIHRE